VTDSDALSEKTKITYDRLVELHGPVPLKPRREPMHELISTMLSHRTTQANEALAFQRMWDRFGSWEAIRDADTGELAATIEPANYPESKAPRIQAALRQIIAERGEPSIDFLRDLPAGDGLAWLMKLPGVGIKTASLVLLFCFSKPVLPVDTHVHRVSQRVGLIGKTVGEVLPPESAALCVGAIRQALETGEAVPIDYRLEIQGRPVWFAGMVSRMTDQTVVWVARDITARKRAEDALRKDPGDAAPGPGGGAKGTG